MFRDINTLIAKVETINGIGAQDGGKTAQKVCAQRAKA